MHPVVFYLNLPLVGTWPLRFFGLFIVDAFFFATLWLEWAWLTRTNPVFAARWKGFHPMRAAIAVAVLVRVAILALPLDWGVRLGAVFLADVAAMIWARVMMGKALDEAGRKEVEFVFSLCFWLLIIGFIGSRLFWIATTPDGQKDFGERPLHALFAIWEGGIVYYGGLLCSAGFGAWWLWVKRGRGILDFGDFVIAGVAFTLFIGRWACFSAGCDFGQETSMPWGIVFEPIPGGIDRNSLIPAAMQGHHAIHPTQLYMSLNGLLIFLLCASVLRVRKFPGQVLWLFFMLYAIGRSTVEFFRADTGRGIYDIAGFSLSSSQIISIPVFIAAAVLYLRGWAKSKRPEVATPPAE
jgi:phosphatidylglycerol:prolipoprotein diacylglycerol transferase